MLFRSIDVAGCLCRRQIRQVRGPLGAQNRRLTACLTQGLYCRQAPGTRRALIEAKQLGIHAFCVTIDTEARDYLPHMYGAVNYTLIDKVERLPLKVADIYRKLTF